MLTPEQISEVRNVARLEAVRAAVFSVAAEALDGDRPTMSITCSLQSDLLAIELTYYDVRGLAIVGMSL